ncbi:TPA: hypothetical protein ACONP3_002340, partial [Staphylococcus aureus]
IGTPISTDITPIISSHDVAHTNRTKKGYKPRNNGTSSLSFAIYNYSHSMTRVLFVNLYQFITIDISRFLMLYTSQQFMSLHNLRIHCLQRMR